MGRFLNPRVPGRHPEADAGSAVKPLNRVVAAEHIPALPHARLTPVPLPLPPAGQVTFYILAAYIFMRMSVVHELLGFRFGILYLNALLAPVAAIAILVSGGFIRALTARAGILLVLLFVWCVAIIPFSVYRGGSFSIMSLYGQNHLLMYFVIVSAAATLERCKKLMLLMMWAGCMVVVNCLLNGQAGAERFSLAFGTLMNPNDLATHALILLPFCVFAANEKARFSFPWLLGYGGAILCLVFALKSGSRAAVVTFAAMLITVALYMSAANRIKMLFLMLTVAAATIPFLSQGTIERYVTIVSGNEDITTEEGLNAIGSSNSRRYLLQESLKLTLKHPLFGVGPGQFETAEAGVARESGSRGAWLETHNTYTEFSCETGLIGFGIYIAILVHCLWSLNRLRRVSAHNPKLRTLHNMAACLFLTFVAWSCNTLFVSLAFKMYFPVLVGFAVALLKTGAQKIAEMEQQQRQVFQPAATAAAQ